MKVETVRIGLYRVALFVLLFGVSSLTYGANQLSPMLSIVTNLTGVAAAAGLMLFYFAYPTSYKVLAWIITLGVIGLVLESLYIYNQYVYSFFVIKRFAYCGLALLTFVVASRSGQIKLSWVVNIIFAFYVYSQLLTGRILQYSLNSDTRPTSAFETYYLLIPYLYFLVSYFQKNKQMDLLKALITFGMIVLLLHRSVISTAVVTTMLTVLLSSAGKIADSRVRVGRTVSTLFILIILSIPFLSALNPAKVAEVVDNISGILSPAEDNTGSWRLEQSQYYMSQFVERPLLGWRYEGYDRGEVMVNEDFAEKGTIIHSQYVDMLYNYGIVGLLVNLLVISSTLLFIYFRNRVFSLEQAVLFSFVASGFLFGLSYQLPVYYWSFTGLAMFYGLNRPVRRPLMVTPLDQTPEGQSAYPALALNLTQPHD